MYTDSQPAKAATPAKKGAPAAPAAAEEAESEEDESMVFVSRLSSATHANDKQKDTVSFSAEFYRIMSSNRC